MVRAAERAERGGRGAGPALQASFRITGDAVIHDLNRDYRGKDRPTDVLAFAQRDAGGGAGPGDGVLGDVVISLDTARRQQRGRGAAGLYREVMFLAAHGLCHLLGYDHPDDAQEAAMNARMAALLAEAARRGTIRAA
ncbi:MAG: rRNA maturation RNase YbeY [Myxococcales bacterium]|nr:rRNA maturation RNase YbeY [Myxococcales bacterium]